MRDSRENILLSSLVQRYKEQNQPMALYDFYLQPSKFLTKGDDLSEAIITSRKDGEFCGKKSLNRLKKHIVYLAETMKKIFFDQGFDQKNHKIMRLLTPEFSFYSKRPLSTDQFHQLVEEITNKLEGYPKNLHFLFSTFVVDSGSEIMNVALYIECGAILKVRTFSKSNHFDGLEDGDPVFNKRLLQNIPGAMIASDPDVTEKQSQAFNSTLSVFDVHTGHHASYLQCVEICYDHVNRTALTQLEALFSANNTVYYPSQINQIVTSHTVSLEADSCVCGSISHADEFFNKETYLKINLYGPDQQDMFGGPCFLKETQRKKFGYFNPRLEALRRNHNRCAIEKRYGIELRDAFLREKIISAAWDSDWELMNFVLEIAPNSVLKALLTDLKKIPHKYLTLCNIHFLSLSGKWKDIVLPEEEKIETPVNRLIDLFFKPIARATVAQGVDYLQPFSITSLQRTNALKEVESILDFSLLMKLYASVHINADEYRMLWNILKNKISILSTLRMGQIEKLEYFNPFNKRCDQFGERRNQFIWNLCKDKLTQLNCSDFIVLLKDDFFNEGQHAMIWNANKTRLDELVVSVSDFLKLYTCTSFNDDQRDHIVTSLERKFFEWCKEKPTVRQDLLSLSNLTLTQQVFISRAIDNARVMVGACETTLFCKKTRVVKLPYLSGVDIQPASNVQPAGIKKIEQRP